MSVSVWRSINRKKTLLQDYMHHSEWTKSLNGLDLFSIVGVLSLPLGIFAVLPDTIRTTSGPSTVLAVMLAYLLTLAAGWHQSELTVSFPKSCLLYNYTYIMVGEVWAFLVGWMTLLDYLVSASYVSRVWSAHTNLLFNESLHQTLLLALGDLQSTIWESSFDLLAVIGLCLASFLQCLGLKVLCTVSIVLLTVCALISSSAILVAFFYANPANWFHNGFFSHGYIGVFAGASRLMYSFIGIESLNYILEESHQPVSRVPTLNPVCGTLLSAFFLFFSLAITLAMDYTKFPAVATLPMIYGNISVNASRYIVSVASVCGLTGAMLVILLPSSRTLQVLSSHRLLFPSLSRLSGSNNSPVVAIVVVFVLSSLTLVFKTEFIVDLLSVTLPLRLLLTVIFVILQRFTAFPIGFSSDVSRYKSLKKRSCYSHTESFVTLNGSTTSCPFSEDQHCHHCDEQSITSSIICRNIGIAHMGEYNYELNKETAIKSPPTVTEDSITLTDQITERSSLLLTPVSNGAAGSRPGKLAPNPLKDLVAPASPVTEDAVIGEPKQSLVKSASSYQAVPNSDTKGSLHTISLERDHSHDCLRSTCLQNKNDESRVFHLYEADLSELPYHEHTDGLYRSTSITQVTQQLVFNRAVVATWCYLVVCAITNTIIAKATTWIIDRNLWVIIIVSILGFILFVIMCYMAQLRTNKTASPRRYQVTLFPFLSLCTMYCLTLVLCATSSLAWLKLFFWTILGVVVYLCYGHVHSSEQITQVDPVVVDDGENETRAMIDNNSAVGEAGL